MRSHAWVRPAGLLLGAVADAAFGDPRRGHPVAGFGNVAATLERHWYADHRAAGVAHTAVLVGAAVALGVGAEALGRRAPVVGVALTAAATWTVLGGTSLAEQGVALADELDGGWAGGGGSGSGGSGSGGSGGGGSGGGGPGGSRPGNGGPGDGGPADGPPVDGGPGVDEPGADLAAARARLPSLCGRDPALLDAAGMARAGTESIAENTSDAVVAPLLWGAVAGVPGLLGYRAVNTLDAMVGYRSARYRHFGWAAARLDDLANLGPARVAAALFAALAPTLGGSSRAALTAWWRDAGAHPSPNAGPVEASAAGALGVGLGGRTIYAHGVEERPRLGDGPPPTPADLRRAAHLSCRVGRMAALLAAAIAGVVGRSPSG